MVVSINRSNLFLSAQSFVPIPLAGHIHLVNIFGSLADGHGAKAQFNASFALGNIALYAKKNNNNKHDLHISFSFASSLYGDISLEDYKLHTLP